jgi:hypothetical protein
VATQPLSLTYSSPAAADDATRSHRRRRKPPPLPVPPPPPPPLAGWCRPGVTSRSYSAMLPTTVIPISLASAASHASASAPAARRQWRAAAAP